MSQNYIFTYSKIKIDPVNPKPEQIKVEDIAHSLSYLTRANGHFPIFYSVGQHCISCCREAIARKYDNRIILAALLHDAGEAYVSDVTRPVKNQLKIYKEIENRLLNIIYTKFLNTDLTQKEKERVKDLDDSLLYNEFYALMGEKLDIIHTQLKSKPQFITEDFSKVEKEYLELFFLYNKQKE